MLKQKFPLFPCGFRIRAKIRENTCHYTNEWARKPVKLGKLERYFCKLEFVEILIGHIVVLDFPGGFHDSFHQRANIHNRGVLLVLGADKKCGDATRIIIIGNLRFRIRQDQCKLFIRINFFVFLIVFNVFSDSID